ncbi:MAG: sulfite exporter TauE/SafE family protein [Sphingobacteriales bacterium]|jgi:uncharacterized membrane protein YfcA
MTLTVIIIVIIIGLVAGMLGGMVGIGGGLVIVPALMYFLAFSQHQAQGTSLGLLVLPVAILAVLNYYKNGYVDFRVVGLLAIGFVVGSYFGSKMALSVPQLTLKRIFAIFMILIAMKMLFIDKK